MAFIKIKKSSQGSGRLKGVRVGRQKSKSGIQLGRITIGAPLLRLMAWSAGDKIAVAVGDGEDADTLRLTRDPERGYKLAASSRASLVAFLLVRELYDRLPTKPADCTHMIKERALYITPPDKVRP